MVLYETQSYFKFRPELNDLRENMLGGILTEIERLYTSKQGPDVKEIFRASTLRQLGEIYFEAGVYDEALKRFQESENIAKRLHQQGRLSRPHLNFGTLDRWIGSAQAKLGNLDVAEQRYHSMIDHRRQYFDSQPGIAKAASEQSMAEAYSLLGDVMRLQGKIEQAKPLLQRALDTRRTWYEAFPRDLKTGEELSGALGSLSGLYEQTAQFPEMIAASEQAVELLRRSAANKSDFPTAFNLAAALRRLGRQYQLINEPEEAEAQVRESIVNYEAALKASPNFALAQAQAADSYYMQAKLLFQTGKDHTQQCQRGIELSEQLLAKSRSTQNRVLQLKLVALSGDVDRASKLADELVGNHTSAYHCLCGAIAYALASEHCDAPQQRQLLDRAIDCVRDAVFKLGFRDFVVLRTDPDFAPLQKQDEYQQLLDTAEKQSK